MNASESACDWLSYIRPAPMCFEPTSEVTCSQTTTCLHPCDSPCGITTTSEITTQNLFMHHSCNPTEEIEMLTIPSIYETMDETGLPDVQTPLEWSWPSDELDLIGKETETCRVDEDDEHTTDFNEDVTMLPLKRLRRQRANDRERRRMQSLNGALNNLKSCIPLPKTKRRVTKLEILRIACNYIQSLWDTLNNGDNEVQRESLRPIGDNQRLIVNGMSVTQRLDLLSNNLNFNIKL